MRFDDRDVEALIGCLVSTARRVEVAYGVAAEIWPFGLVIATLAGLQAPGTDGQILVRNAAGKYRTTGPPSGLPSRSR